MQTASYWPSGIRTAPPSATPVKSISKASSSLGFGKGAGMGIGNCFCPSTLCGAGAFGVKFDMSDSSFLVLFALDRSGVLAALGLEQEFIQVRQVRVLDHQPKGLRELLPTRLRPERTVVLGQHKPALADHVAVLVPDILGVQVPHGIDQPHESVAELIGDVRSDLDRLLVALLLTLLLRRVDVLRQRGQNDVDRKVLVPPKDPAKLGRALAVVPQVRLVNGAVGLLLSPAPL